MFLDEVTITVHGGKGGDGLVTWRHEKYVPRGGPAGGDGGNGGDVIFRADSNTDTLTVFAEEKVFAAEDGENGKRSRMAGKAGEHRMLKVPPGTLITEKTTGGVIADLVQVGEEMRIARGGRGGYGNAHFASSVRQAPDFAEKGEPGEVRDLHLELKLVADVGIIGFPNAGKSTLISVISKAKPKIADYAFTTLVPNLGVVRIYDRSFIVCDLPGLIEGASEGKGLGDLFLRHIERCGVLVHLLDVSREDLVTDYKAIRTELQRFSSTLASKRELVVLNKIDLIGNDVSLFSEELQRNGIHVHAALSAATTKGIQGFLNMLLPIVLEEREKRMRENLTEREEKSLPILRPHLETDRTDAFLITEEPAGTFTVQGKRIEQITRMTDWASRGGIDRFRDVIKRSGLRKALERAGALEKSIVHIGTVDVSKHWW